MATLRERIQSELHEAMRAHDETRKSTLRMLTAAVRNADIEARSQLDDSGIMTVVQKQAKQRRESILEFQKASRDDLVQNRGHVVNTPGSRGTPHGRIFYESAPVPKTPAPCLVDETASPRWRFRRAAGARPTGRGRWHWNRVLHVAA